MDIRKSITCTSDLQFHEYYCLFFIYSSDEVFPFKKTYVKNWFTEKILNRLYMDLTKIVKIDGWLQFDNANIYHQFTHTSLWTSAGVRYPRSTKGTFWRLDSWAQQARPREAFPHVSAVVALLKYVPPKAIPFTEGGLI